jgi:hypothetical protein
MTTSNEPGIVPVDGRTAGVSSQEIHQALFGGRKPEAHTIADMKDGIRSYIRKRQGRAALSRPNESRRRPPEASRP